jgi:beta-galactosidase
MKKRNPLIAIISFFTIALLLTDCSRQDKNDDFKIIRATLPDTYLLGTHLCRFPMPATKEMFADMENLKNHGFNLIKIQTHWAIDEPIKGKYEFERYDSIVQHAKDLGLFVYMGLTLEQAPAWLYEKYPDCRMVGRNGLPIKYETQYTLPSDGKPGPCFDHPEAMKRQIKYIQAFVRHFAAYENILVWNTWQEIAYWAEGPVGSDVCYCENTQRHFRKWLKNKYGTLENLNMIWGANYGEWEQVVPHRQSPIGLPVDKDFRTFMENEHIAQTLKARYKAIKEIDPLKRPVFAHKGGVNIGSGQDWTYARCEDFMGSSCYPAWTSFRPWDDNSQPRVYPPKKYETLYNEMWSNVALSFDYLRCSNPDGNPVWAAEFQGGPVMSGFQKGRVPSASDIRRWMLTAMSSGVTTISFWVTRAEIMAQENNGFSLLDSKGNTTERFEEASRIGQLLRKHSDLFASPSKPKAKVGIIINEENYQFCKTFNATDRHLSYSLRGWYHMLWRNEYPVDFVNITDIDESSSAQYSALILPFPLSLSDNFAVKLKNYITGGGNLICEGSAGRINENSLAVRGEISPVIAEMAGAEQKNFILVPEPNNEHRWTPQERTWGEFGPVTWMEGTGDFSDMKLLANYYLQTFICKRGIPIFLTGNDVSACVNQVGKGKIWLLGTFIGHNGTAYYTPAILDVVNKFMKLSGIVPQRIGNLLIQKRIRDSKEAWIITNPTDSDIKESFDISTMKNPEILIGEKLEIKGDQAIIALKSLDIAVLLFEKK